MARQRKAAVAHQQEHNLKIAAKGSRYAERIPDGSNLGDSGLRPNCCAIFTNAGIAPDSWAIVVVGDIQPDKSSK